jgi:hypothetical protein
MVSELARGPYGGDRLLHELEPLDRVQRDDSVLGPLDRRNFPPLLVECRVEGVAEFVLYLGRLLRQVD